MALLIRSSTSHPKINARNSSLVENEYFSPSAKITGATGQLGWWIVSK